MNYNFVVNEIANIKIIYFKCSLYEKNTSFLRESIFLFIIIYSINVYSEI